MWFRVCWATIIAPDGHFGNHPLVFQLKYLIEYLPRVTRLCPVGFPQRTRVPGGFPGSSAWRKCHPHHSCLSPGKTFWKGGLGTMAVPCQMDKATSERTRKQATALSRQEGRLPLQLAQQSSTGESERALRLEGRPSRDTDMTF